MSYLARTIDNTLDTWLKHFAAIAIDGPKGVGKTDTATRRANTTWYLDNPDQRVVAQSDFQFSTAPSGTLVIDEWQRLPQVWDAVRRQVDSGATPGRFILTGSATPNDSQGTHSGAGRIMSLRMRPMALHERGDVTPTISFTKLLSGINQEVTGKSNATLQNYATAITDSGFPAILSAPAEIREIYLDNYLERVIDKELPEAGFEARYPEVLRRWLTAYAAATSNTTSYSKLLDATTGGDGTQPSKATTIKYREQLTRLWLLDPVPGWLPIASGLKRLQQAPKHHLADPALAARLLQLTATDLVTNRGSAYFGPLFESLSTLSIRVLAQAAGAKVNHMRINSGEREIDLIIKGRNGELLPIEVKLSGAPTDSDVRHLLWLRDQLPDQVIDLVVITAGEYAYRRPDGVAVIPLAMLGL